MEACCCVMPYLNPEACMHCSTNNKLKNLNWPIMQDFKFKLEDVKKQDIVEVIEKYDDKGSLIEKIIKYNK